jgi:peptidoglycan/LPS O-acetylase OafA/YrhL
MRVLKNGPLAKPADCALGESVDVRDLALAGESLVSLDRGLGISATRQELAPLQDLKSSPSPGKEHLAFVDALRGIAAVVVCVFHLHLCTESAFPQVGLNRCLHDLLQYLDLGKLAVAVFFMVSGYLIPVALDRVGNLSTFARRRVFRLYPAYWFSIVCALLVSAAGLREEFPSVSTIAANFTMAQGYLGRPDIIGVFWTLQIELTFYVLCGLLFALGCFDARRWLICPAAMLGALLCGAARFALGKPLPVAMFVALGLMFAADALRRRDAHCKACFAIVAVLLIPTCWLAYAELAPRYIATYYLAMFVFICSDRWRASPVFSASWLRFLADVSYSVYLLQDPIGLTITQFAVSRGLIQSVAIGCGLTGTIAASYLVYRAIELPCIRIGRELGGRRKMSQSELVSAKQAP